MVGVGYLAARILAHLRSALLSAVMLLAVALLLTSCHTTRATAEHTTQHTQAAAVSHATEQSSHAADWWQSVRLSIDSVVVMFCDSLGMAGLQSGTAITPQSRASPRPVKVKLNGLRLAADAVMHDESNTEREQDDSTHVTGTTATDTSSREEVTGIAKPPDLTLTIIVIATLALILIYIRTR